MSKTAQQMFEDILSVPPEQWGYASIKRLPPGVEDAMSDFQTAYKALNGHHANKAEALAFIVACAVAEGGLKEKIAAMQTESFTRKKKTTNGSE